MSHLVIVESPSKSKTISKYLSDDFVVKSSKGHIRDLAISGKGGLGVDIENEFVFRTNFTLRDGNYTAGYKLRTGVWIPWTFYK